MSSVAELEAEAEATRQRLYETMDRIQDKLTVSGMVDEFMGQAGLPKPEGRGDLILDLLRRHPIPVMLAAAGIGFLIYRMNQAGSGGVSSADAISRARRDVVDVPVLNDGHARTYDPDLPSRHPLADVTGTTSIEA